MCQRRGGTSQDSCWDLWSRFQFDRWAVVSILNYKWWFSPFVPPSFLPNELLRKCIFNEVAGCCFNILSFSRTWSMIINSGYVMLMKPFDHYYYTISSPLSRSLFLPVWLDFHLGRAHTHQCVLIAFLKGFNCDWLTTMRQLKDGFLIRQRTLWIREALIAVAGHSNRFPRKLYWKSFRVHVISSACGWISRADAMHRGKMSPWEGSPCLFLLRWLFSQAPLDDL